jgi:hypothetical protein
MMGFSVRPDRFADLVGWLALVLILAICGCKGGDDGETESSLRPDPGAEEPLGELPGFPLDAHIDQHEIRSGRRQFDELFALGDDLFEAGFGTLDGVGILRLPNGDPFPQRFARAPPGGGRVTGPNAQACVGCHDTPFPTSAGEAASNVLQDPTGLGAPPFNIRSVPSLFGSAVLQRLAEEMTEELLAARAAAIDVTVAGGPSVELELLAKGISFGRIRATRAIDGTVVIDASLVRGVDPDLVVRPYGWKGNTTTLRDFVRGAASGEMGLESDELVAKVPGGDLDPDGDGVEGELSIGDITAITVYIGAQPVPVDVDRLAREGIEPPVLGPVARARARGRAVFLSIGCADCHVPSLDVRDPLFTEPTLRGGANYIDRELDPVATGLDAASPASFDLIREGEPPRLLPASAGGAVVELWGDLRRHDMGAALADARPTVVRDASGRPLVVEGESIVVAESVFLTAELWGIGNTGPWLHDGRAASIEEAIRLHGVDSPPAPGAGGRSDAQESRDAFVALSDSERQDLVEFLEGLVLAKVVE